MSHSVIISNKKITGLEQSVVTQPKDAVPLSMFQDLSAVVYDLSGYVYSIDLNDVLTVGNDAGGLSITNLNDVALTTINGSAYPPATAAAVDIADNTTDDTFYLTFVDGAGVGKTINVAESSNPISLNPNTGNFNVGNTLKISSGEIAIGGLAGSTNQGTNSISVGAGAGTLLQGDYSVAIGTKSGEISQGNSAVAIGDRAGRTNQDDNSIVLNATGLDLNTDGINRFFVKPVRGVAHGLGVGVMKYDPTTGEITYSTN